jgi:hypothetical protein
VAVHTNIYRRDGSLFALVNTNMAILAVDLVNTGMHFMREEDGLFGFIFFLAVYIDGTLGDPISTNQE